MNMFLRALVQQGYEVTLNYHEDSSFRYNVTATRKGVTQSQGSKDSLEDALEALLRYMLSNLSIAQDREDEK